MPPVLPRTKFPRHNEKLEADAANGQSVRKHSPTNANVRHAPCAVNRSHQANHASCSSGAAALFHVHAQCIKEWCWHRREPHPKLPVDIDTMMCFRDSVLQAVADTDMVLLIDEATYASSSPSSEPVNGVRHILPHTTVLLSQSPTPLANGPRPHGCDHGASITHLSSQVAELIPDTLKRMSRLSEPSHESRTLSRLWHRSR